jgi:hypothetical protein
MKMKGHLSEDQVTTCAAGRPTAAELDHIRECPECGAELERFGTAVSLFRSAVRHRIDERVALRASGVSQVSIRPAVGRISKWHWALGAAALFALIVLPFFRNPDRPQPSSEQVATGANADAIMDAVNRHLSRTVPAPMEPVMALIPGDELTSESGGVQ